MKRVFGLILIVILSISLVSCTSKQSGWHLNKMYIQKLWGFSKGESQTIAFIDTGISDELQTKYQNRIVYSYNIADDNEAVIDHHGHGTEMVSVACGDGFSNIWGVAPAAKIIVLKAVSDNGKTDNEYLYRALKVAENNGATIVNVSIGGHKSNEKVMGQINTMTQKGITIVASAGDYNNKDLLFPACVDGVISVEAASKDGTIWKESNHSEDSIIRMPGCDIDVLTVGSDGAVHTDAATGTSQAAAITSGYVALIKDYYLSQGVQLSNSELIELLKALDTKNASNIDYMKPFESSEHKGS